ncbi:two-component sensor histidine kinase [Vallitalea longa]|uniref:histidine kinase n=1 Tax=Vallitalea longa TaxID=2936439 RepID=A0A9W5YEM8_9FIRM|nr:HAMP domain-containing sensor histidine kinase [Vallitalea longa]GKX32112.1 two-component sensor histidine kinase [Vallitalea longa]
MFKSFVNKFFFIYAILTLIIFMILTTALTNIIESFIINNYKQNMLNVAEVISEEYISAYSDQTKMATLNFEYQVAVLSNHIDSRIWILSSDGTVQIDSEKGVNSFENIKIENKSIEKAQNGEIVTLRGNFYGLSSTPLVTVIYPIKINSTTRGIIVMHSLYPEIKKEANYFFNLTIICLLFSLLFSIMLMFIFSRRITKTFQEMNKTARSIANGNFESRIMITTNDDVGELATNLNFMAAELGKLEEMRRSFIANISHDFRSPLTSIKGFVQAILDGTIPPENQEKYLNIVLDETNRLTKLTNEILLLTKLENNGIQLDYSVFDIHLIIREVLIKFERKISEKKIHITLLIDEKQIMVTADKDKIQRVIYNLIDNAVKFCSKGDRITIETTKYKDKVNISVKDNGPGIKENEIKYIFNRFHKTDRSRGEDKKGTGLGLSIVKEIMTAHGETINVNSKLNVGTEFVFTLALAKNK